MMFPKEARLVSDLIVMEMRLPLDGQRVVRTERMKLQSALSARDPAEAKALSVTKQAAEAQRVADMWRPLLGTK